MEYALPASDAPTLAEVLSAEDGEEKIPFKPIEEPTSCSAVQVDFLQAVSQQIIQAQVNKDDNLVKNMTLVHKLDYWRIWEKILLVSQIIKNQQRYIIKLSEWGQVISLGYENCTH